jgi:hypothetical protein
MTPAQYHLLQRTLEYIRPVKTEIGWAQFKKLTELVPEAEFDADTRWRATIGLLEMMLTQEVSSKLMVPITRSDPMKIPPGLANVTKGYVEFGLGARHVPAMKRSFLWTMKQHLDGKFDSEMEEAWALAFDLVEGALRATASEVTAPPPPQNPILSR